MQDKTMERSDYVWGRHQVKVASQGLEKLIAGIHLTILFRAFEALKAFHCSVSETPLSF